MSAFSTTLVLALWLRFCQLSNRLPTVLISLINKFSCKLWITKKAPEYIRGTHIFRTNDGKIIVIDELIDVYELDSNMKYTMIATNPDVPKMTNNYFGEVIQIPYPSNKFFAFSYDFVCFEYEPNTFEDIKNKYNLDFKIGRHCEGAC